MSADAAGSPSTARDRAIETAVTSAVVREVAGFRGSIEVDALAALMETLPIVVENAVRLVPAGGSAPADNPDDVDPPTCPECSHASDHSGGECMWFDDYLVNGEHQQVTCKCPGSAPADEVEQLRWELGMALSRVAAAEDVQVRMGESLPDSGPWESWSERDRAVRDYEGDLSTALATETDTVGERLREVEGERDEARAEVDRLRGEASELLTKVTALVGQLDTVSAAGSAAITQLDVMRPVVEAAERWAQAPDSCASAMETADYVLRERLAVYRAGGSAPHQGATTAETALLASRLRATRALLGAGETTSTTPKETDHA